MLFEPTETAYDLRWRMFGIPVRVHPMFWLMTLLMGQSALRGGIEYLLAWVGCVFVSILIHELGHVVVGRHFGAFGRIVLYSFGGLAIGSNQLRNWKQRVAVSFAGPAAGFLFLGALLGLLFVVNRPLYGYGVISMAAYLPIPGDLLRMLVARDDAAAAFQEPPFALMIVGDLVYINLMWGIMNLLPVWPLDGGQICREICVRINSFNGVRTSLMISLAVSGLFAAFCIVAHLNPALRLPFGSVYTAIFFGIFAFQSWQLLQQDRRFR